MSLTAGVEGADSVFVVGADSVFVGVGPNGAADTVGNTGALVVAPKEKLGTVLVVLLDSDELVEGLTVGKSCPFETLLGFAFIVSSPGADDMVFSTTGKVVVADGGPKENSVGAAVLGSEEGVVVDGAPKENSVGAVDLVSGVGAPKANVVAEALKEKGVDCVSKLKALLVAGVAVVGVNEVAVVDLDEALGVTPNENVVP